MRALIVARDTTNDFVSLYPITHDGEVYEIEIDKILEWDNGIEATITGYIEDKSVSFFMTDYYLYKNDIKQGDKCKFKLSAFAYNCNTLKEKTFKFEGQQAIDYLNKMGEKPTLDANGEVQPVIFNLENLVAFFQVNDKFPDDAEFQSPIHSVTELEINNGKLFKFNITIYRDSDIIIPLYVKSNLVDFEPQLKLPIQGNIWVQGCLINAIKSLER